MEISLFSQANPGYVKKSIARIGYAVLRGKDYTVILCHGSPDGGISITEKILGEIEGRKLVVCCHPKQVAAENTDVLLRYNASVFGDWEGGTRYRIENGGYRIVITRAE